MVGGDHLIQFSLRHWKYPCFLLYSKKTRAHVLTPKFPRDMMPCLTNGADQGMRCCGDTSYSFLSLIVVTSSRQRPHLHRDGSVYTENRDLFQCVAEHCHASDIVVKGSSLVPDLPVRGARTRARVCASKFLWESSLGLSIVHEGNA